jgi:hypothetical protein
MGDDPDKLLSMLLDALDALDAAELALDRYPFELPPPTSLLCRRNAARDQVQYAREAALPNVLSYRSKRFDEHTNEQKDKPIP